MNELQLLQDLPHYCTVLPPPTSPPTSWYKSKLRCCVNHAWMSMRDFIRKSCVLNLRLLRCHPAASSGLLLLNLTGQQQAL